MTPEERIAYQEYLADFDPITALVTASDDYDYPLSEDGWLEEYVDRGRSLKLR